MPHPRTESQANVSMSTASSTATTSSGDTEADQFRGAVEDLMLSDVVTEVFVERAGDLIVALGSRPNPNEFGPAWYKSCKARFDVILSAMLQFSVECGGPLDNRAERSQRYIACAIVACTRGTKTLDDTHRALTDLALTWFGNLLWIFKGNSSYKTQTVPAHSGEATPTFVITKRYVQTGAPEARTESMRTDVLKRQGYKCPLTGVVDRRMPNPPLDVATLRCAHIVKRAVAVFPRANSISELDKSRYRFAMSTLDILAHYMAITHDEVVSIIENIDSPANGIAMEPNYHDVFDLFELCLVSTDQPDVYTIRSYMRGGKPAGISACDQIVFMDHSTGGIPLPNPDFIRLHAALSGVLHASGAGKDIDNIIEDLERDGDWTGPPERIFSSGFRFLDHMEARASAREMLSGVSQIIAVR